MGFVQKVVQFIIDKKFDFSELTVVVPSDRSINKIREGLTISSTSPVFSPEITTIDKWMRPKGKTKIDPTRQLIALYHVSSKLLL